MPLFQAQVYPQQAPGVEGDFCDHAPRVPVQAGPGGLVSASEGVYVARFGWLDGSIVDPMNAPTLVHTHSIGGGLAPAGFMHREQQGLNTNFLGGSTMYVPGGFPITLHSAGGFFVLNRGTNYAQVGMKAFARLNDGGVIFGATGSAPGASVGYTGAVAASTFAVTASILGNVMNVTAVTSGVVVPGATVTAAGIPAGCKVVGQLTGAPGGAGQYGLSYSELAVPSGTVNGTYGTLNVTVIGTGSSVDVGDVLSGTGVTAGTTITANGSSGIAGLTGMGGLGFYAVDNNTVVASTGTLGATDAYETKWFATSAGSPGEIIKMSSWPLG